jgi:hypothetical protein
MTHSPPLPNVRAFLRLEHFARISRLWEELQAARKDPEQYDALVKQIRREADAFRRTPASDDPAP